MYSFWPRCVAVLCYTTAVTAFQGHPLESYILPITPVNTTISLTTSVGNSALDGVFITQPNATSYEWWYFDAIASDLSASIVVQPITTYFSDPVLELAIQISLANGTLYSFFVPGDKLFVSTNGEGSNGMASDGSYSWWSRPQIGEYEIELCLQEQGIEGKIKLQAVCLSIISTWCELQALTIIKRSLLHMSPVVQLCRAPVSSSTGTYSGPTSSQMQSRRSIPI